MLPSANRLRTSHEFRAAVRGRRAGGKLLVVHGHANPTRQGRPARVGFVVSKAVGNAVTRNLVKRRLRHCVAERLHLLPEGFDVVVRANPAAATASFEDLGHHVERLLLKVIASQDAKQAANTPRSGGADTTRHPTGGETT